MIRGKRLGKALLLATMAVTASLEADVTIGGARPTTLHVPASYDPQVPAPLVLLLHGCPSDAAGPFGENVLRFGPVAEERGVLFAAPDGSGSPGRRSWGACSGSFAQSSAYLRSLIEEAQGLFAIDPARIYVAGFSDGGFMSFRMATDHPDLVAAIATLSGGFPQSQVLEGEDRIPTVPVPFLQVSGTADQFYELAVEEMDQYVRDTTWEFVREEVGQGPDLVTRVRTNVSRWGAGCLPEGFFELWTLPGVGHTPQPIRDGETNALGRNMIDWLLRHPRGSLPVAAIIGVPPLGVAPLQVTADAAGSTAPAGTMLRSYCWSFDGRAANGVTATHTYDVPGRHFVRLLVVSDEEAVSPGVEQPVIVTCPDGELGPWAALQIGEAIHPGAARFDGAVDDSDVLICGGGSGLLGRGDSFFFVHRELEGNFRVTVRVEEMSGNLRRSSVALMIRADAGDRSPFAAVQFRLEGTAPAQTGLFRFRYRLPDENGRVRSSPSQRAPNTAGWLRIERRGDVIRGEVSLDNREWIPLGEQRVPTLGPRPLVGIAAMNTSAERRSYFEALQARVSIESIERLAPPFRRSDCNDDGTVDISDAVCTLEWLFLGGDAPSCVASANTNGDGQVDLSDPVSLLNHLFLGGPPPVAPFPKCGPGSPTDEEIGCERFERCP